MPLHDYPRDFNEGHHGSLHDALFDGVDKNHDAGATPYRPANRAARRWIQAKIDRRRPSAARLGRVLDRVEAAGRVSGYHALDWFAYRVARSERHTARWGRILARHRTNWRAALTEWPETVRKRYPHLLETL